MVDLDTFLTTLYVVVDEHDKAQPVVRAGRPGPAPALSRSEVVTLAIFAQWACFASERAFYRFAQRHLRAAFPTLPDRTQYNRELRQAHDLLVGVGQALAQQTLRGTGQACAYEVLDGMGVATRSVHRRGSGWLFGQAGVSHCNRVGWYHGVHLLTVVSPEGVLTGYAIAPAATSEQVGAETLLGVRAAPDARLPEVGHPLAGGLYLADTGFEGKRWQPHWRRDYAARVLTPPKIHQPFPVAWPRPLRRAFSGLRQIVETVHGKLLLVFRLANERPHAMGGLRARLAAMVALHNFCCWLNQQLGQPLLAFADLLEW